MAEDAGLTNRRWPRAATLALVILWATLSATFAFNRELAIWGDNAEFVVLSESLATGQGFALINSPARQVNNRFPPGYPVLLLPLLLIWGKSILAFKLLSVLLFVGTSVLLLLLFERCCSRGVAFLFTLVTSSNFAMVSFSSCAGQNRQGVVNERVIR